MLEVGTDGCLFKFQAFRGHSLELFPVGVQRAGRCPGVVADEHERIGVFAGKFRRSVFLRRQIAEPCGQRRHRQPDRAAERAEQGGTGCFRHTPDTGQRT